VLRLPNVGKEERGGAGERRGCRNAGRGYGGRQRENILESLRPAPSSSHNLSLFLPVMQADDHAFRDLCRSLVASLSKSHCVMLRVAWMASVMNQRGPDWENNDVRRRIMHRTYSACFKWLVRPRSDSEIESLSRSQCVCKPPYMHPAIYEAGRQRLPRNAQDEASLFLPFCTTIEWILRPFNTHDEDFDTDHALHRLHLLSRRRVWPRSVASMLPHGPGDTIRSLVRLLAVPLEITFTGFIFLALDCIVKFCHSLVVPYLVQSTGFMIHGVAVFSTSRFNIPTSKNSFTKEAQRTALIISINNLTSTLAVVVSHYTDETQRTVFHSKNASTMLRAYDSCLKICSASTDGQEKMIQLQALGGRLYSDCADSRYITVSASAQDLFHKAAPSFENTSSPFVWQRFILQLEYLQARQRCCAPGCIKTRLDGRLKTCGRCQRVVYCSTECQKAAWTHTFAHQHVCGTILRLCAAVGLPKKKLYEFDMTSDPNIAPQDRQHCLRVLAHFADITKLEMSLHCTLLGILVSA
jgi:hypothetical protein